MADRNYDAKIDEAVEETFPASDAPATVVTGARLRNSVAPRDASSPDPSAEIVRDNRAANRFEITSRGETAFLEYERQPGRIRLIHTEVPPRLQGQGLGNRLAKYALDSARADRLTIIAECPVVQAYLRKHPIK